MGVFEPVLVWVSVRVVVNLVTLCRSLGA
jgi:hypothetical protein